MKNTNITVTITKITIGKDGRIYLTIRHPLSTNYPSLVLKNGVISSATEMQNIIKILTNYEKDQI